MRAVWAMAVVLLVAAGIAGAYWQLVVKPAAETAGAPGGRGGPPPGFALPVEAVPVKLGKVERQVAAIGSLRSSETVIVRPEVAGRVAKILFQEGNKTKAGQVLLELDSAIEKAELIQARANLELSKANFERADELAKRGSGTARALDEARAKLKVDEASLALKQAMLDKYNLSAPFDGVLGLRQVSVGDFVSPGTAIVNLESIDPIKVDFRVPEAFLTAVKTGQQIAIAVDAMPDRTFNGQISAIDPQVDPAGRSVVIRAKIPNPDDMLKPGLFARVTLTLGRTEESILVPEQAVVPVGTQHFVYRVVEGKVAVTKVKLGQRRAGEVEIVEGLSRGDTVITAGHLKVRDGQPVQVMPSGPQPAPKPAAGLALPAVVAG